MTDWTGSGIVAAFFAGIVLVSACVGAAGATAPANSGSNEPPIADAGQDQEVSTNQTVHLDASRSRDPDGAIAGYEWAIERPNGTTFTPDCPTCARTEFRVDAPGTYNATVTVTDGAGAARSDTLRVAVNDTRGPSVTISGPDAVDAGSQKPFTASMATDDVELLRVEWLVEGVEARNETLSGQSAQSTFEPRFAQNGSRNISARAYDRLGRVAVATHALTVNRNLSYSPSGGSSTDICGFINDYYANGTRKSGDDFTETSMQSCSEYFEQDINIPESVDSDVSYLEMNGVSGTQIYEESSQEDGSTFEQAVKEAIEEFEETSTGEVSEQEVSDEEENSDSSEESQLGSERGSSPLGDQITMS